LTKNFRESLRLALTGGGEHQSFGVPSNDSVADDVDLAFLDDYARDQWEGILHYVVNSVGDGMRGGGQGPTDAVKQLLEAGKLVTTGRHSGKGITQAGFSFLLQEVNAQVWTLLLLWIENAEKVRVCAYKPARKLTNIDGTGLCRGPLLPFHARVARARSCI
jgi:transcription initiation factor TFIIH subunit 4